MLIHNMLFEQLTVIFRSVSFLGGLMGPESATLIFPLGLKKLQIAHKIYFYFLFGKKLKIFDFRAS